MSPLRLHRHFPARPLGPYGYQEFCAGTIPVKRVLTLQGRSPIGPSSIKECSSAPLTSTSTTC